MRPRLLLVVMLIIAALCFSTCGDYAEDGVIGEGEFVGIVLNKSSYTLNVDSPIHEGKYVELEPDEYTEYALEDKAYTFKAYYASDGKFYDSVSFRIDSVKDDVEIINKVYDWAVIFKDPSWLFGGAEYYP